MRETLPRGGILRNIGAMLRLSSHFKHVHNALHGVWWRRHSKVECPHALGEGEYAAVAAGQGWAVGRKEGAVRRRGPGLAHRVAVHKALELEDEEQKVLERRPVREEPAHGEGTVELLGLAHAALAEGQEVQYGPCPKKVGLAGQAQGGPGAQEPGVLRRPAAHGVVLGRVRQRPSRFEVARPARVQCCDRRRHCRRWPTRTALGLAEELAGSFRHGKFLGESRRACPAQRVFFVLHVAKTEVLS